MESFYSAAEHQQEDNPPNEPNTPVTPDILRDLDRQSVGAISAISAMSQTTISTISMAPDRAPPSITVSNFPVNLHAQLGKKTTESQLLMAGYVPQVSLWQRGVIDVTIAGTEHSHGDDLAAGKFSFYLPNFQKVKNGLDVEGAFVARPSATTGRPRSQLFPRHYRSQVSSVGSSSKFVDFGMHSNLFFGSFSSYHFHGEFSAF